MVRIGITGQAGFVGINLSNYIQQFPQKYELISFEDKFFYEDGLLDEFVKQCDVIVHLAAVMRSSIEGEVYRINMELVDMLITSLDNCQVAPCVLFTSSIQDNNGSEYGRCKQDGIVRFDKWARARNTSFVAMRLPNLFGSYAKPGYSSFIATFCYKFTHGETPIIFKDNDIPLIYIGNMVKCIMQIVDDASVNNVYDIVNFNPDKVVKVTAIWEKLKSFQQARENGIEPICVDEFDSNLYDTFKSYINYNI